MTFTPSTVPRIVIIGGGPAGLILLLTLHKRGIPATLYERDEGFSMRKHLGGMLDLGWMSGQRALRENGLQEVFNENSRAEAQEFKIMDGQGNVFIAHGADPDQKVEDSRPEIDRSVLRKILLDAIPAELVKWGHTVTSVRPLGNGEHELTFADGSIVVSDILIGADGANSRVRPLVSSATPIYHDVNGAEISLAPEVVARPDMKDISDVVGLGSLYAGQGGTVIGCQRNGDGRIRAYAWSRLPLDWTLPKEPEEARRVLLEKYERWAPWVRKLIANCDDAAIYQRPLFYLPVGHRWTHVPGVTLVGDAAHLMSPFAGAGANLAMFDALQVGLLLSEAIKDGKSAEEREAAVASWEERMFEKSEKWAALSMNNLNAFFDPRAPHTVLEQGQTLLNNPESRREA